MLATEESWRRSKKKPENNILGIQEERHIIWIALHMLPPTGTTSLVHQTLPTPTSTTMNREQLSQINPEWSLAVNLAAGLYVGGKNVNQLSGFLKIMNKIVFGQGCQLQIGQFLEIEFTFQKTYFSR